MNILIVDDDPFSLDVLEHTLVKSGHRALRASNGQQAMDHLRDDDVRMVITDWEMPGLNGLDLCRTVRSDDIHGYVYMIMLTGRDDAKSRREGISAGADDFLFKPLHADDLLVCLKTAERILALETRDAALFALAKLAESRDSETGAHVERVQTYCRLLAQNLAPAVKETHAVNAEFIRMLYRTSALHDMGKVAIPDSILLKPGRLTPDEFEAMKTHTILGSQTLDAALLKFPNASFLRMARDITMSHHEKFDGTGYPAGLAGDQIPFSARLVAVADVYDALTSRRVYKEAMPHERARQLIIEGRGRSFDPDVVDAFLKVEQQLIDVRLKSGDLPGEVSAPSVQGVSSVTDDDICSILIVEDSPIVLRSVGKLLAGTGYRILSASNAKDGMSMFIEHEPDIIVSDWEMPGGTGVEFCRQVRTRAAACPVHFIMLTSHSDQQSILKAYNAGVNDFVSKPYNPDELVARVKAGLRVCELHRELAHKTERLLATNSQLKLMNARLDRLSTTDELTGLNNRRHAIVRMEEHWLLAERYGSNFSVAAIDVDHFKKVNDTYGHEAGDTVLCQIAGILRESTRRTDIVCRMGGEEFLIVFPSQKSQEAFEVAQRCRLAIERAALLINDLHAKVTISVGIASRTNEMKLSSDLLRAADKALYRAKETGRNRIVIQQEGEPDMPVSNKTKITPSPIDAPAECGSIDMRLIAARCGGDLHFAESVVERFRVQAPSEVKRLDAALEQNDRVGFQRGAHTIKSMAAYVTADTAANICRQLEELAKSEKLAEAGPLLHRLHQEIQGIIAWLEKRAPATDVANRAA